MSVETQSDISPGLEIPRMTFEFDPKNLDTQSPVFDEFSFTIPNSDIANSVPREDLNPSNIPEPQTDFQETLEFAVTENEGGAISITTGPDFTAVRFGFKPLVELEDPGEGNIFEQHQRANAGRIPQFKGSNELFKRLAKITSLQYQFGVPAEDFDSNHPVAPARFSFRHGDNVDEPTFVITQSFEEALKEAREKSIQERLTSQLFSYITYVNSMKDGALNDTYTGIVKIPAQHRRAIFDQGGDAALANRTGRHFTEDEIAMSRQYVGDAFDVILQEGDLYLAEGHNLDLVTNPRIIAMVAVGSISKYCREIRQYE